MTLLIIGEAAAQMVKRQPDFVAAQRGVLWRAIAGLRNRIAHGYHALDFGAVWAVIEEDLPPLLESLAEIG